MHADYGIVISSIGFLVLLIAIYVSLVRWVFRINDIVSYLNKIDEKLSRIVQEKAASKE
jgi:hypothetical protein